MSDKKDSLVGPREMLAAAGLSALGAGVAQFSWPVALIVIGIVLLAVAFGYLK